MVTREEPHGWQTLPDGTPQLGKIQSYEIHHIVVSFEPITFKTLCFGMFYTGVAYFIFRNLVLVLIVLTQRQCSGRTSKLNQLVIHANSFE